MKNEFFPCNGTTERFDRIVKIGKKYLLIFGYYVDEAGNGYEMRKYYDELPDRAELKADIDALINASTDRRILTGFKWGGKPVYLSTENQANFKNAYDLARDTAGATLPVKFKLGEDAEGAPVYHTFTKFEVLQDFILKACDFVNTVLIEGWAEKDAVEYDALLGDVQE